MKNLFYTFEKMKYISAKLYPLQGKNYFIMETKDHFYFDQQNGDILETITVFSKDVRFVCNDSHTNVYAIEIDEKQLKLTVLPEQNEHLFELAGTDEFVIGLAIGSHSLLVKTCRDLSEDSQKINMYYIDTKADMIMLCNDNILNTSYHMPYISICGNEEYIIAESAVMHPYEIDEARKNTSFIYKNDILAVSLRRLIEAVSNNKELKWNVISSAKEGYYVNILQVNGSHIWLLETTTNEIKTNIVKYDLSNGMADINLFIENRIDKAVFNEDTLLCMYKWNSSKEQINIYNLQGDVISNLNYAILTNENDEIELNEILSILDDRYVIFHATDYSTDDEKQIRVIYDMLKKIYKVYYAPFVMYCGKCY